MSLPGRQPGSAANGSNGAHCSTRKEKWKQCCCGRWIIGPRARGSPQRCGNSRSVPHKPLKKNWFSYQRRGGGGTTIIRASLGEQHLQQIYCQSDETKAEKAVEAASRRPLLQSIFGVSRDFVPYVMFEYCQVS